MGLHRETPKLPGYGAGADKGLGVQGELCSGGAASLPRPGMEEEKGMLGSEELGRKGRANLFWGIRLERHHRGGVHKSTGLLLARLIHLYIKGNREPLGRPREMGRGGG